ncbi:MAG: mechanosensitive ion channel family protein [Candidatus Aegiribacteria sp.]|nr:mechanosensitive ion channel family protein [Candidatus Aegiribacteria sp.]
MSQQMILHGIEAVVLGLAVGLILWMIRKHSPGSRLKLWILLAGIAGASYLVMKMFGVPEESSFYRISLAATIMLSANTILQVLNLLLWDYFLKKQSDIHIPRLIIDMINFIVLAIVAVAILNGIFGVKLTAFLVTSTVLSAVIGLSLQDILGNLFAGLALQMERPYKVGEWIGVGEEEGIVVQMNWRTLTILTRARDHVIIPNATISKNIVTNYSRPDRHHMCRIEVGMAYGHSPGQVKNLISGVFARTDGVLEKPLPKVFLDKFDDYTVNYDVRFWILEYHRKPEIENAVRTHIWYSLRRAGLSIPFPIRDVTVRTVPEDHDTRIKELLKTEILNELRKVELFKLLNDEQILKLAESSSKHLYSKGEALVHQGDSGDSLLIISNGKVEVYISDDSGRKTHLADLQEGDYFGEMSLLTGEPRSASVSAVSETEVIVVKKDGLADLLETEPTILEPLSEMLEKRLEDLSSRVMDRAIEEKEHKKPVQKDHILGRIRDFFGIR